MIPAAFVCRSSAETALVSSVEQRHAGGALRRLRHLADETVRCHDRVVDVDVVVRAGRDDDLLLELARRAADDLGGDADVVVRE